MSWEFKYYDINTGPDWDAIEQNCDWFRDMKGVPQDSIWHAEGDVQIHTRMVCSALIDLPEFKALNEGDKHVLFTSALMHDIEKRSTTVKEFLNGRMCIVAPRHAKRGESVSREILYQDYDCPYKEKELIAKLVRWHGKPLYKLDEEDTERSVISVSYEVPLHWLVMLAKADILGRTCYDAQEQLDKIEFFKMYCEELNCLYNAKQFDSSLARYTYLREGGYVDYQPFDNTKFEVVMMSAIAGSGKDTYIKNNYSDWPVISLDDIRVKLKIKPTDKSGNGTVIQEAKEQAKILMRKHSNFVWNATNITFQLRSQLIDLFTSYGGRVTIVYVEVPYKTLIKQNANRPSAIPIDVVNKMVRKLEPPTHAEAHEIIYFTS